MFVSGRVCVRTCVCSLFECVVFSSGCVAVCVCARVGGWCLSGVSNGRQPSVCQCVPGRVGVRMCVCSMCGRSECVGVAGYVCARVFVVCVRPCV